MVGKLKKAAVSPDRMLSLTMPRESNESAQDNMKLVELVSQKFGSLESLIGEIASGLKTLQSEVSELKKKQEQ